VVLIIGRATAKLKIWCPMTEQSNTAYCFALGAVKEYLDSCAEYDKSVCPEGFGDWTVPETQEQWKLISLNAWNKREELLEEFVETFNISRTSAEAYWDKALRMGGAIGDD